MVLVMGLGNWLMQKVKAVKPVINQPINPTQLNLFDTSEFSAQINQAKTKRTRKSKETEGEQLSLF